MTFLIDNALPARLAALLRAAGYDAVHVRERGLACASDSVILASADAENRIVISADTDFGALLAVQNSAHPSFILFREPALVRAEHYATHLLQALPALKAELARGCVVVFRANRVRVRTLPFSTT